MYKEKLSMLGLAVIAAGLLAAISITVNAIAENRAQVQMQGRSSDQGRDRDQERERDRDHMQTTIYGSQMMTERERQEHRAKMRAMKTEQEREAYRLEHHNKMQERARAKGLTLPDEPPKPPAVSGSATPAK